MVETTGSCDDPKLEVLQKASGHRHAATSDGEEKFHKNRLKVYAEVHP